MQSNPNGGNVYNHKKTLAKKREKVTGGEKRWRGGGKGWVVAREKKRKKLFYVSSKDYKLKCYASLISDTIKKYKQKIMSAKGGERKTAERRREQEKVPSWKKSLFMLDF